MILRTITTIIAILALLRIRSAQTREAPHQDMPPEIQQLNDREFRLLASDIADQLAKNARFKLQVISTVIVSLTAIAGLIGGLIGWSLSASLKDQRDDFQRKANLEISEAKKAVEAEIKTQLETKNVTDIINKAANAQAKSIIDNSLNPSISEFQKRLDKSSVDLDHRIASTSKAAEENVEKLDKQLKLLTARNELTNLADEAISDGSVLAYQKLEEIASGGDESIKKPAVAELFAVFQAYSMFAPTRIAGLEIDSKYFNPVKKKQDELSPDDIIPKWKEVQQPLARAKLAQLMTSKVNRGSYSTASFLITAIKSESHLETLRYLGEAFQKTTGNGEGGKLDQRHLIKWWNEHEEEFRKDDTDPKPTPLQSPSPAP